MKKSKLKALHIMHNLCTENKELLKLSGEGTCINCDLTYHHKAFEYTLDGAAICPSCNVDMVVPEMTNKLLHKMRGFWL